MKKLAVGKLFNEHTANASETAKSSEYGLFIAFLRIIKTEVLFKILSLLRIFNRHRENY